MSQVLVRSSENQSSQHGPSLEQRGKVLPREGKRLIQRCSENHGQNLSPAPKMVIHAGIFGLLIISSTFKIPSTVPILVLLTSLLIIIEERANPRKLEKVTWPTHSLNKESIWAKQGFFSWWSALYNYYELDEIVPKTTATFSYLYFL